MKFKATTIDSSNKKVKLEIIAEDRKDAISNLRKQGFLIIELYENQENSTETVQLPSSKNDLLDKPETNEKELTHPEKPNPKKKREWLDASNLWFIIIIFVAIQYSFNHDSEEIPGSTSDRATRKKDPRRLSD